MKINQMKKDEYFEGFYLIKRAEVRKTRAGKDYIAFTFQDDTGEISGNLWDAQPYNVEEFTAGKVVHMETLTSFIPQTILMAISCGAVFMGANTYIGNAPNFMVRSIAEENGIKMPSFFGYMLWSLSCLIPVFLIDMLIFFL